MTKIIAVAALCALCAGCDYMPLVATHSVREIGRRVEYIDANYPARVADDGSIAIEDATISSFRKSVSLISAKRDKAVRVDDETGKKYLIGSPVAIERMIKDNIDAKCYEGRQPKYNQELVEKLSGRRVCVRRISVDLSENSADASRWHLMPQSVSIRNALPNDLPIMFKASTAHRYYGNDDLILYEYEGERILLHFQLSWNHLRTHRKWYGYPAQILLIPALVFDVVTSPLQFFMIVFDMFG